MATSRWNTEAKARPFLRWAGGKAWLARVIDSYWHGVRPRKYFEPFLGSGAIFFRMQFAPAMLSDANAELINAYQFVRDEPHLLLAVLREMDSSRSAYERVRGSDPADELDRAVRFLYLNRLGFSGIYRVNRAGRYNVPYGGQDRSLSYFWRDDRLLRASKALAGCQLAATDFSEAMSLASDGDLVYCDPVYLSGSSSERFARYNHQPFAGVDLGRLMESVALAAGRGATVWLSWPSSPSLPRHRYEVRRCELVRQSTISARATAASEHRETLTMYSL